LTHPALPERTFAAFPFDTGGAILDSIAARAAGGMPGPGPLAG
jgi:hypothetical protein